MMKKKLIKVAAFIAPFVVALPALADADPDLVSNSQELFTAAKENLAAVISANVGTLAIVFVSVIAIFFIMRLIRSAIRGR